MPSTLARKVTKKGMDSQHFNGGFWDYEEVQKQFGAFSRGREKPKALCMASVLHPLDVEGSRDET